ncbi:MAG: Clp protease ClpP [Berryella intestinalis]|uniref:head maturation protease, ClpP-related n=1 Tax=Berryella intestinalis TaxID=1531429 RepID=UPI002A547B1C|nr:head maturation protease, ClpP-related [Berryella intestinalis]MDD7369715.1 Clp protease ClpP [Berryella intestinalis]MDY3129280.1 Clp protease ClpP [Berryella intestinalis]
MLKIENEAQSATVYLYGTIGRDWWDEDSENTAKSFSKTLDELSPKPLEIRIDSCGGDVYEGFAIASAIQRYAGATTAFVDGIAASAASYIAVMADKVVMNDYAQIMIHDAWTFTGGNSSDLRAMAERLDSIDGQIAMIIAGRSGMDADEVRGLMDAETWFSADDAKDRGLCDEVVVTEQRVAACLDASMAKLFKNIPESLENAESHADGTICTDAARPVVLGNRVYRTKE